MFLFAVDVLEHWSEVRKFTEPSSSEAGSMLGGRGQLTQNAPEVLSKIHSSGTAS
jgi:hypothetical protein